MALLDSYLARRLVAHVGAATALLVGLFVLVTLGDELNKLNARYGAGEAALVALAEVPRWTFELFPSAALIGVVVAVSGLIARSEWVAMQAGGYGLWRQAAVVAGVALVAASLVLWAYDRWGPEARAWVETLKGRQGGGALVVAGGVWVRDAGGVRFLRGLEAGRIQAVEDYRLEGGRVRAYLRMRELRRLEDGRWQAARWERWRWVAGRWLHEGPRPAVVTLSVDGGLERLARTAPERMDLAALGEAIAALHRHGLEAGRYEVRYYGAWLFPFYVANLALLGFALVVRRRVGRAGMGRQLALGLLVGVGIYLASMAVDYALVLYGWGVLEGKLAFQLALLTVNLVLLGALRRTAVRSRGCPAR